MILTWIYLSKIYTRFKTITQFYIKLLTNGFRTDHYFSKTGVG